MKPQSTTTKSLVCARDFESGFTVFRKLPLAGAVLGLGLTLASCSTSESSGLKARTDRAHSPTVTSLSDGWYPGEHLDGADRTREGKTPSGFEYQIFSDGSGGIKVPSQEVGLSGWSIDCRKDKMSDHRSCSVMGYQSRFAIFLSYQGMPQQLCLTTHDSPGGREQSALILMLLSQRTKTVACLQAPSS